MTQKISSLTDHEGRPLPQPYTHRWHHHVVFPIRGIMRAAWGFPIGLSWVTARSIQNLALHHFAKKELKKENLPTGRKELLEKRVSRYKPIFTDYILALSVATIGDLASIIYTPAGDLAGYIMEVEHYELSKSYLSFM